MGTQDIQTYEPRRNYPQDVRSRPVLDWSLSTVVKNPYRVEAVDSDAENVEIYYYLTRLNDLNDGIITDDELTPIYFKGDKFLGYGDNTFGEW